MERCGKRKTEEEENAGNKGNFMEVDKRKETVSKRPVRDLNK